MKIIVNRCYGGFSFSDEFLEYCKTNNIVTGSSWSPRREDEELIQAFENFGPEKASGFASELEVVEIPDDATDFVVTENDGLEEIIYVVEGKIHFG